MITGHNLTDAQFGTNRHQPGRYECECGEVFPSWVKWQRHVAEKRREAKSAKDADNT